MSGVSPDTPVVIGKNGGMGSKTAYSFTSCPWRVWLAIAQRFQYGLDRGYPKMNWAKLTLDEVADHLITHIMVYLSGNREDDHLGAMICRAAMLYEIAKKEEEEGSRPPSFTHEAVPFTLSTPVEEPQEEELTIPCPKCGDNWYPWKIIKGECPTCRTSKAYEKVEVKE